MVFVNRSRMLAWRTGENSCADSTEKLASMPTTVATPTSRRVSGMRAVSV